jgi:hypothetical protein
MSFISLNMSNSNASVQLQVMANDINWNHEIIYAIEITVTSAHRYFPRTDYLPPWIPRTFLELISTIMTFNLLKSTDKLVLFYFKISARNIVTVIYIFK